MNISNKGLLLALAHVVLLFGIGAKMLYDRTTLPRAWIKTMPVDPNMPIRGRYLRLTLAVEDPQHWSNTFVDLRVQGDQVTISPAEFNYANYLTLTTGDYGRIFPPVAFFLSDKAEDPSRHLLDGQELWVEATIPPHGHPRPIRLGIKHNGVLTPID
jgi:hypothetical protein